MKFKDIEKQLKNEIEAHSPSFESVLSKCRTESTDNLVLEKSLVPVAAGGPTRLKANRSTAWYVLSAILLAVVATMIIFIYQPSNTNELSGGYFVIDINPSFEISYDKDGKVLAVTALNEDAEVLLYELDLNGKSYTEAIGLIVDNCVTLGFLSPQRQDNAILATAISEQGIKDEVMTEKIKDVFSNTLTEKNVVGEVLTGVQDERLNIEAEKYGIDGQKLSLIQKYIEVGGEIDTEQYSKITIRELYHSISEKEKSNKNEKIDNLKNEANQLENELFDKITQGLDSLKEILPEKSELKSQLDEMLEKATNEGAGNHIDSLLEMLDGIEDEELGLVVSVIKAELESKKDEYKKAENELKELNKTAEEKRNDRLNNANTEKPDEKQEKPEWNDKEDSQPSQDENTNKEPHSNQDGEAHFPKEDEHLPHNKDDENKSEKIQNDQEKSTLEEKDEDEKPNGEERPKPEKEPNGEGEPTLEEAPTDEGKSPKDDRHH